MDAAAPPNTPGGLPPIGGEGSPSHGTQAATPLSFADEGLRGHQGLAKFRDTESLGKSYIELERKIGEKAGIKPLTAESTPEDIAAYRQLIGVPDKPDGYDVGELSFPEAATPTEAQMGAFKGLAHELHMTPAQVKGVLGWYAQDISQQWNAIDQQRTEQNRETMAGLTKKYGAEAGQLLMMAQKYVERRYGQEGLEALDFTHGGMGSSPLMIEMLIESARLTGHDQFIVADSRGSMMDPTAAKQKHDELAQKYYRSQDEGEKAGLKRDMDRLAPLAFSR